MAHICNWCEKGKRICEHHIENGKVCEYYKNRGMVEEGTSIWKLKYCPKVA